MTYEIPTYQVTKSMRPGRDYRPGRAVWHITRLDHPAHIGVVNSRKEAVQIARLLAGWRGQVVIGKAR